MMQQIYAKTAQQQGTPASRPKPNPANTDESTPGGRAATGATQSG